jgi:hypothetical protein
MQAPLTDAENAATMSQLDAQQQPPRKKTPQQQQAAQTTSQEWSNEATSLSSAGC